MSATVQTTPAAAAPLRAADPTAGFRRWAAAVALPAAFAAQLVCNAIYSAAAMTTGHSDGFGDPAESLSMYAAAPGLMLVANYFALLGSLLLIPGAVTILRVFRSTRPRLALLAVVFIVLGYVAYFGINGSSFDEIGIALQGGLHHGGWDADLLAGFMAGIPFALPLNILFLLGNMPAMILLGVIALITRGIPKLAGIGILAWFVLHIVGLVAGSEWFEVAGGALQTAGLGVIAAQALRMPLAEWRARG